MISRIPKFLRLIAGKECEFHIPTKEKIIYLTFDDGPVPEVTPKVLDILKRHNAKATFFCVGDNIRKYPELYKRLLDEGHNVGNHTMHHLQGLKTSFSDYMKDVEQSAELCSSNLFRPPYGRISKRQKQELLKQNFRLIFWSVISFDYSKKISQEKCLKNSLKLHSGDIILFHDSLKAEKNMLYALERVLLFYSEKGFRFCTIR